MECPSQKSLGIDLVEDIKGIEGCSHHWDNTVFTDRSKTDDGVRSSVVICNVVHVVEFSFRLLPYAAIWSPFW